MVQGLVFLVNRCAPIINERSLKKKTKKMQDDEKKSADEHTEHSIEEDDNEDDNLIQSKTYNIVVGGGRFTHRRLHNAPTDSLNYYSLDEMLRERVKQLLQSNFYFLLYLCMIAICILLLVWMLFHRGVPRQTLFIFFEAIVTVSLAFEVLLRIYIERKVGYSLQLS